MQYFNEIGCTIHINSKYLLPFSYTVQLDKYLFQDLL